ncbi:MAG: efflux RND transporter permease subunit [Tepidisphaeraceae bacterium]
MWIVRLALRRPYTFIVASMLIIILGVVAILWMPTDIFPEINIPVIAVAFNYSGMTPEDMEGRIITNFEGALTVTVNDIEHIESQSLNGIGIVKIYFYPNAKIEAATAQVTAIAQTALRSMPPGCQPPLIIQYNASNVPILQLGLGSDKLSEQALFDYSTQFIRTGLITVQGAQIPWPYGGKQRQIMVDLDPDRLYAWGISPSDVSNAISSQNLVLPAGTTKIGSQEYAVHLNSSPTVVDTLNDLPIKTVNGTTVYIKDVAHVRDGFSVQNSIVHADGKRGALMVILKNGGSSTLDIVRRIKAALPVVAARVPASLKITPLFDQSIFVRASVNGVAKEAAIAAGLTGLMVLLFLGSWRSTLIVVISFPLSILVSIIVLYFLGDSLIVMTLGGMALAVGILVDDATVAIENIHRNIGQGKPLLKAILDGSQQIAVPAFVSTLCICIVFVPVAFISGAAKYLFTPLAMAVVFAMLTSYVLSRTLVPTLINYLLPAEMEMYGGHLDPNDPHARGRISHKNVMWRFHDLFNALFEKFRRIYGGMLVASLKHRALVLAGFALLVLVSLALFPLIGRDFFPTVDAGQIRLHVRTPPGTRIEETERVFGQVERVIRRDIPASEIDTILDNMGIPNSSINLALSDGSLMSPSDGEVLVSLKPVRHPTDQYIERLNRDLRRDFPDETFFFQPADIVTQVLNFGIAAPIDVQINGPPSNAAANYQIAKDIERQIATIPGAADVHILQVPHTPDLRVNVDRTMASQVGVTEGQIANDMLVSLSGTAQLSPNFWLDPKNGRQYTVLVQTPQYRVDSINDLANSPVVPAGASASQARSAQLLGNLAEMHRGYSATNITHYAILPCFDVMSGVRGTDLHSVAVGVDRIIADARQHLPRGSTIAVQGQVQSMNSSFAALSYGLIFAVVLVYLLMVINFQSWLDPLIILMALPGALSGILWMLFVTGTTLSVPALMGAIMSIGVATANSILVITFANDQRQQGMDAHDAALAAGLTRLRPVIMTALAMIIGMLPMSLGLGEGGEQNAPLGRAVIGGLVMATFATLFFVPIVYSKLRQKAPNVHIPEELR